ncbi:MAG TPA: hypothetical protein VMM76_23100 [Pirellulaceae bacterium]|nr:hypothetical protein [Pirellulaceae bacterium]
MIAGAVTGDREIVIQVDALAADRSFVSIQAVVDTGFNGFVTLPLDVLNALGATAAGTRRAELGDGHVVELGVYFLKINWQDEVREILAIQAETTPLVGMSLLWGSRVCFDAEEGGTVAIDVIG